MTRSRRGLVLMLGVALLATPVAAEAQQTGKVWRIGFLGVANAASFERLIEAGLRGLSNRPLERTGGAGRTAPFRWASGGAVE
jgi:hypothetical protein